MSATGSLVVSCWSQQTLAKAAQHIQSKAGFCLACACVLQLQRLDVGDNQLRYLPDDLSKLGMTCTDLDVSANLLNYLPHALGDHLFNLKFLEVSFNQLGGCDHNTSTVSYAF